MGYIYLVMFVMILKYTFCGRGLFLTQCFVVVHFCSWKFLGIMECISNIDLDSFLLETGSEAFLEQPKMLQVAGILISY